MKAIVKILFKFLFKLRLVNFGRLKFNGPSIVIPNHISFLDAVFLYLYLPSDVVFVVNTEISKRFALFLRLTNYIAIDPLNPYSLKQIIKIVKSGTPVILFPEGRITTTGGLMKVYDGVGFVAQKTNATLYPIIFTGLEYSKFSRIQDKVKTSWFPEVQIYVEKPLKITVDQTKNLKLQKRELSNRILEVLQNTLFKAKYNKEANLFDQLLKAAKLHGTQKIIAEDITQKVTYKNLILGSYVLGNKFRMLFKNENQIGVLLPNALGHVMTLFGLSYANKTPAILNFTAGIQSILDCAETAQLKSILTSRIFIDKANLGNVIKHLSAQYQVIYLEDLKAELGISDRLKGLFDYISGRKSETSAPNRIILFTSGSESKPKGVLLNHSNIMANINQVTSVIDLTPQDKILNALPMFHSFGLTAGALLPILSGVEVYLYPSPLHYKTIPEVSYDRNATIIFGTSTFLAGYAKFAHPYDFQSIRYCLAGAEKLKDETRELWQEKFGIRVLEGYGTTETAPVLSFNTRLFNKKGTVGKFLPGIEWKLAKVEGIEDGGNLLVKGPNVMEGYLLHGKGFLPVEEWYDCGDIVKIDEEGFITIQSRLKRFAKVSGEMVSLNLVEELAEQCFNSGDYAAINISDLKRGEKIILYTTSKTADRQTLRQYLSDKNQSPLLLPAQLVILEKLPMLGSGKTDYVTLKTLSENGGE